MQLWTLLQLSNQTVPHLSTTWKWKCEHPLTKVVVMVSNLYSSKKMIVHVFLEHKSKCNHFTWKSVLKNSSNLQAKFHNLVESRFWKAVISVFYQRRNFCGWAPTGSTSGRNHKIRPAPDGGQGGVDAPQKLRKVVWQMTRKDWGN